MCVNRLGMGIFMLFTIFFSFHAEAQQLRLNGTLYDQEEQTSLPGATIQLISLADSVHWFTTSNESGIFEFSTLKEGSYALHISYVGYEVVTKNIGLDADLELSQIMLSPKADLLQEIVIVEKPLPILQKGDTTEFNAQAYRTQPDASAEDLIKKMPGIIMVNGVLQAQGDDVKQILVDGKPFFGNDPSVALKNLPAEMIARIQVFDRQSDQAQFTGVDDGQSFKTINIVTQPDKKNGRFGKIYSGYGLNNRYGVGGNINVFDGNQRYSIIGQTNNINVNNFATDDLLEVVVSGGQRKKRGGARGSSGEETGNFLLNQHNGMSQIYSFGLNYNNHWTEKVEVNGSYYFKSKNNSASQSLSREQFFSSDSSLFYDEQSLSASRNDNHRFHMKIVYTPDERNSIVYQPTLNVQENSGSEQSIGENYLTQGKLLNSRLNAYSTELLAFNLSHDLLFKHRFEKKGRTLSLRADLNNNQQKGNNYLLADNTFYTDQSMRKDSLNQSGVLDHDSDAYATHFTYTEPIGKQFNLQMHYEASLRSSVLHKSNLNFEEESQSYTTLDSTLSNHFISQYVKQAAATSLRFHKEKISLTSKISFQRAKLSFDQSFPQEESFDKTFQNVLPSATLHLREDGGSNIRIAYHTSTHAPDAKDLQQVVDNNNPLMLRQGNPGLKQQYNHQMTGKFTSTNSELTNSFSVLLGGNYTQNYVGRSTLIASQDTLLNEDLILQQGVQVIRPVNFKNSWNVRSFLSYGLPLSSLQSNLNLNSSLNFNRTPRLINEQMNYAHQLGFAVGLVLSSNMSERLDFTLSTRSKYTLVENTLRASLNNNYFNQGTELRFHARTEKGLFAETDLNHQFYAGLADDFNQSYYLVNISVGKKIFKNQLGEFKLSVFDLLNQNNSISRNVGETYVEDVKTSVLNRFAMLTFTYQLRNFRL